MHSGAVPGYAVTDRIPARIAAMVYVDSGPATGALDPGLTAVEVPLPSREELEEEENLDGDVRAAPAGRPAVRARLRGQCA